MDNDVYGHVNNVVYYSYFDTVINEHLIRDGGLDIHDGSVVGYCVESQCRYPRAAGLPRDHRRRPARRPPRQILGAL
jgi:acyl-CoA thioester hydrolase